MASHSALLISSLDYGEVFLVRAALSVSHELPVPDEGAANGAKVASRVGGGRRRPPR